MSGVNKAILVGRLGKDPESKAFISDGTKVCSFSVATSEEWKDKNTGEKKERTEWHRVIAYRKLAEICGQWLKKGQQVYIEGKIRTRKYEKDGQDHFATEIIADSMQMIGGKNDNSQETPKAPVGIVHDQASRSNGYAPKPDGVDDIPF